VTELPEIVKRARSLVPAIAADLERFGGILRCGTCGRERPLGDVAAHTSRGWPKCCGHTMGWVTQRELDEEKADA
jgi:hypothetical protein